MNGVGKYRVVFEGSPITGVGFRVFLHDIAEYLSFKKFSARNIGVDKVEILIECSRDDVDRFIKYVKSDIPERVNIRSVPIEEYNGSIPDIESSYRLLISSSWIR